MTKKTFLSRVEAGIPFFITKYSGFLNGGLFCCNTTLCGCRHDRTFSALPVGVGAWTEVKVAHVVSDSLRLPGLYSSWNSPGQNTGVGSRSLLQGIFPTQGSNPGLPH